MSLHANDDVRLSRRQALMAGAAASLGALGLTGADAIAAFADEAHGSFFSGPGPAPADQGGAAGVNVSTTDAAWLWTSRDFFGPDGKHASHLERAYGPDGNIVHHHLDGYYGEGDEITSVLDYDFEIVEGVPTGRQLGSWEDGSAYKRVTPIIWDESGVPSRIHWGIDDTSRLAFDLQSGRCVMDCECDTEGGVYCLFYDEAGYSTRDIVRFSPANNPATCIDYTWHFDDAGRPVSVDAVRSEGVIVEAAARDALGYLKGCARIDPDALAWAGELPELSAYYLSECLCESVDEINSLPDEDQLALATADLVVVDLPTGQAYVGLPESAQEPETATLDIDEAGNIVAVYDEAGTLRCQASFQLVEHPTPMALYYSGYKMNTSSLFW